MLAVALFGAMIALWATPIVLGKLDEHSGFVAFASSWQTNSAYFPALESGIDAALDLTGLLQLEAGLVARVLVAVLLGGFVLALSCKPIESSIDLVNRASLVVAALVLLVPAQYPCITSGLRPFYRSCPGRRS